MALRRFGNTTGRRFVVALAVLALALIGGRYWFGLGEGSSAPQTPSGQALAAPRPLTARVAQIGGELSSAGPTTIDTRSAHRATCNCGSPSVVWGNWYVSTAGQDTAGSDPITVTLAIEDPDGHSHRVLFDRQPRRVLAPGETVTSDPVEGMRPLRAGEVFHIRAHIEVPPGGRWPGGLHANAAPAFAWVRDEGFVTGDALPDGTGRPLSGAVRRSGPMPGPIAVLAGVAKGSTPAVAVVGDSILWGDTGGREPLDQSWLTVALRDRAGLVALARPRGTASSFSELSASRRLSMAELAGTLVSGLGIEDLRAGAGAAELERSLERVWAAAAGHGLRVLQTTLTPDTTSFDGWGTLSGQRVTAWEDARVTVNEWLRTGAGGNTDLDGVIDVASAAESARNTGLWRPGLTDDGLHPSTEGQTRIARLVDVGAILHPAVPAGPARTPDAAADIPLAPTATAVSTATPDP